MAAIKGAKSVRALHATGARHTFSVNDIQTAVARRVSQSGELPRRGRPLTVTADTKVVIRDDHSKKKLMAFWPVEAEKYAPRDHRLIAAGAHYSRIP